MPVPANGQMNGCHTTGSGCPILRSRGQGCYNAKMSLKCENDDVMENENSNRTRRVIFRLTPDEYAQIERKCKASTFKKLSDYLRHCLFEKPVVTVYRNGSADEFLNEFSKLRSELNAIGNNFNQSVKRLHTLSGIAEFRRWQVLYEVEKKTFMNKVEEIKISIRKISASWLQ